MSLPFTPDRRVRFLHHLAVTGNVRRACALVGVSAQAAYVHKRRDAAFAHGWHAALLLARDAAEEVLAERALHGVEETIFYRGEAVGSRVRFDARLLLAHLARLDAHADQAAADPATGIAARFDEYLAELHGAGEAGPEPAFAPPDDDFEAPPQWTPAHPAREDALYAFPPRVEDLPAETLAELNLDAIDPRDLWSHALAHAQRQAETAAAASWDAAAHARLAALDMLFEERDVLGPPPFHEVQMASEPSDPPRFHEVEMGRGTAAAGGGGGVIPSSPAEGAPPAGETPPEIRPEAPIETKSAKALQDPVNRVNLPAGRPARPARSAPAGGQRMKSSAVSVPSAAWTKNVSEVPALSITSVTA
ncbi:hypothetical protein [Novosphingobium sp.]|uniref:hypothetical protein n=1 Tax=Novosphingobium sp. TaxID=1874826 RepID=UPI0026066AE5|nr:hypothetical protein [Novosphingobium sp.]